MTIHKAKGLEFEVVIVPDLQAGAGSGKPELLSWLERGLPPEVEASDRTNPARSRNFLSRRFNPRAPIAVKPRSGSIACAASAKSRRRGDCSTWPLRARAKSCICSRGRSTRQRKTVRLRLAEPSESLLKTAWPALEEEISDRFDRMADCQGASREESSGKGRRDD